VIEKGAYLKQKKLSISSVRPRSIAGILTAPKPPLLLSKAKERDRCHILLIL